MLHSLTSHCIQRRTAEEKENSRLVHPFAGWQQQIGLREPLSRRQAACTEGRRRRSTKQGGRYPALPLFSDYLLNPSHPLSGSIAGYLAVRPPRITYPARAVHRRRLCRYFIKDASAVKSLKEEDVLICLRCSPFRSLPAHSSEGLRV